MSADTKENISESISLSERLRVLSSDQLIRLVVSLVDRFGPLAKECVDTALHHELDSSTIRSDIMSNFPESVSKDIQASLTLTADNESNSHTDGPKKKKPRLAREFNMSKYVKYSYISFVLL